MATDTYHHGNLRDALLSRAEEIIAEQGVAGVSLRSLAADIGVSHAAPRHHFSTRDGLLTALAAQGYDLLADALQETREQGAPVLELGVEYVRFAESHPAHFAVMFDSEVLLETDPRLLAAQHRALGEIKHGIDLLEDPGAQRDMAAAILAGWTMMHGLVELQRSNVLERAEIRQLIDDDLLSISRRLGGMLYGSPGSRSDQGAS